MADETDDTKNTGEGPKWAAYLDDNGNTYYYNSETNESSWEKPDEEFILVEEEEQAEAAAANAATDHGEEEGEKILSSNNGNKEKEGEGGGTPYHISSPLEVADADAADVEESSEVEKEGNNFDDEKNDRQENTTSNNNDESATWIAYKDDNGNEYFYNSVTQATQWEKPEGVTITYAQEEEEEEEGEVEVQSEKQDTDSTNNLNASNMMGQEIQQQQQESPNVMKDESSDTKSRTKISEEESYAMDVDIETPQQEEDKDVNKTLDTKEDQDTALVREAYDALKSTDSIFEPDCTKHLGNLVKVKGQDEIPKAMNEIVESYKGQTAICGVLSLWITDLAAASSSASFENSKISSSSSKKSKENNMDKRIMSKASSSSTKNISSKTSTTTTARAACKALQDPRVTAAETIREISGEVIFKFAKDNFTKTGADSILKLVTKRSSKSSFVQKMMDSDQWRKLLIELFASNKDNPLLMGCLQTISQRGHIREISKQINPVDIFDVFNEMMVSELTIIGKIAMGGVSFLGNNNGNNNEGHNNASTSVSSSNQVMEDSISNLKEKCCSTAFTYFYAQHFIKDIIERLRGKKIMKQQGGTTPSTMSIDRAIQKYERLSEELEEELVSGGGGESHIKKRRVNLALCVSDLYKRDRKRLKPATTFTEEEKINMSQLNAKPEERKKELSKQNLESAVMDLIKMFSEKKNIDSKILNRLLFPKNLLPDQKYSIGELLIAHPSSVKALYSSLFQYQGGASTQQMSNIKSPELRQDCAKLLAKAVIASKESFHHLDDHQRSNNNTNKNDEKEEIRLWRMFLKASQICNKIENLVSFTVRDYKENLPPEIPLDVSIGGEISYLAIKSAPVAQGLLLWISEISSSPEFEAGAVYSTMAPSILSLVRLIAKYHPFTRPTVLKIALVFLKHNNNQSEMGYERIKSLKEKIFRLLLWLSALGLGLEVYGEVERMLTTDKSNEIDPPLLRYLLIGTLDIIQISPPDDNTATSAIGNNHHHLSIPFIKLLSRILSTKASMDAILSPHFPSIKKIQLQHLLSIFSRILSKEKQKAASSSSFLSEDDIELVKVLQNIYAQ
eukprot:CAMPEP_0178951164 /NCGR_PEP_ID=MMETSP0789-20121207/7066_1 /TAXON_ID=3005 /ORGANISM="Rhizosolenia setigera, Strain CCMP 1694" /LENGTH=1077 /DNA_ID=CAMNT_0020631991 /DNA_START=31 /DNA_END=3264 /DNA_ORIENTATION=+